MTFSFFILALALGSMVRTDRKDADCEEGVADNTALRRVGLELGDEELPSVLSALPGEAADSAAPDTAAPDTAADSADAAPLCARQGVLCDGGVVREVDLSGQNLTRVPAWVWEQTSLERLYLQDNALDGALPAALGDLAGLARLDLSKNRITRVPAEIGRLANLTELDLSANRLETLPEEFGNLRRLEWLFLFQNQLAELPVTVAQLTKLRGLFLWGNPVTNPSTRAPLELSKLAPLQNGTQLEYLMIRKNQERPIAKVADLTE